MENNAIFVISDMVNVSMQTVQTTVLSVKAPMEMVEKTLKTESASFKVPGKQLKTILGNFKSIYDKSNPVQLHCPTTNCC